VLPVPAWLSSAPAEGSSLAGCTGQRWAESVTVHSAVSPTLNPTTLLLIYHQGGPSYSEQEAPSPSRVASASVCMQAGVCVGGTCGCSAAVAGAASWLCSWGAAPAASSPSAACSGSGSSSLGAGACSSTAGGVASRAAKTHGVRWFRVSWAGWLEATPSGRDTNTLCSYGREVPTL
jgi:hypothetical protein